jgi:hypothetical protein
VVEDRLVVVLASHDHDLVPGARVDHSLVVDLGSKAFGVDGWKAEHADESTRVATNWVREQKLENALPNAPKITTGEVLVQKTGELVQA